MNSDPHVQLALAYRERFRLTAQELADKVGVTRKTVDRWKNSGTTIKGAATRRKIEKVCGQAKPRTQTLVAPDIGPTFTPVVGLARASSYDPAIDSIGEFLASFEDKHAWGEAKPGCLTVVLAGDSMLPRYPDGTFLLVSPTEMPQRGDLVVAALTDLDEAVVKLYDRRDNIITLSSLNRKVGATYQIHIKNERGRLQWIWPVLRAEIRLRKQRWAEAQP